MILRGESRSLDRTETLAGETVAVVYVNDPMPTDGPAALRQQMRETDICRRRVDLIVASTVIESGGALTREGRGRRLQDVIDRARTASHPLVLIVANVRHLAKQPSAVLLTIADILDAGMALCDPTGELHPTTDAIEAFRELSRSALVADGVVRPWTRAAPVRRRPMEITVEGSAPYA